MSVHHCQHSVLERVEFTAPRRNTLHAHLVSAEGTKPETLDDLRGYLGSQGYATLMDVRDGRPVIEVRGIDKEQGLIDLLKAHRAITGDVRVEKDAADKPKAATLAETITDNSLLLSALFYDLGNVAYLVSGYQRGRHNKDGKFTPNDISEMMIGAAFSVGDIGMTVCGKNRGHHELLAVEEALREHLKQKGIVIPDADVLTPETIYKSGMMQETYRFVEKNIIKIKCATESVAGLFTIHSALKKGERNNFKLAGGVAITTGWLASFLLEKPRGHKIFQGNEPAQDFQEEITRNPRGWLARPAAMANNIGTLLGANTERLRYKNDFLAAQAAAKLSPTGANLEALNFAKNRRFDYAYNVVSACSFLIANSLFGLSGTKKAESKDDTSVMNDMVLLAANMLESQPPDVRDAAIGEVADVVAGLSHVTLGSKEIAAMIHQKIDGLAQSGWKTYAQSVSQAAATGATLRN